MPLDGSIKTYTGLRAVALDLGLQPISEGMLAHHKREQIKKHPPSLVYRYREYIPKLLTIETQICAIAIISGGFTSAIWDFPSIILAIGFGAGCIVCLTFFLVSTILVKGPAKWRESLFRLDKTVPEPIYSAACRLAAHAPVTFILGELYQEKVRLDPYLIAAYGTQRVILGIWEDNKIIACA